MTPNWKYHRASERAGFLFLIRKSWNFQTVLYTVRRHLKNRIGNALSNRRESPSDAGKDTYYGEV